MNQHNSHSEKIQPGDVLLSEPFLEDPNFVRTVIMICAEEDNGHVGLVLNKPIKNLKLEDVLDGVEEADNTLYLGGPVEQNMLQFIHTLGDQLDGAVELTKGIYWGGNFEQLRVLVNSGNVTDDEIRFFIGYSGWDEGQLNGEMEEDSWIISDIEPKDLFDTSPDDLWRALLKKMGGKYRLMSNYPVNPRLN